MTLTTKITKLLIIISIINIIVTLLLNFFLLGSINPYKFGKMENITYHIVNPK